MRPDEPPPDAVSPAQLSRLRWRCRRGMRELDTLLSAFLQQTFLELTPTERHLFEELLEVQDPLLYAWLLGTEQPEDPGLRRLLDRIREHRPV